MNPSISLFRSLLREAKKVDNYNFRLYAIRRVKLGFQINRNLTGYVWSLHIGRAFSSSSFCLCCKIIQYNHTHLFSHFSVSLFLEHLIIHAPLIYHYSRSHNRNEADLALREGQENLDILRRQVVLGSLYPSAPSVMENAV